MKSTFRKVENSIEIIARFFLALVFIILGLTKIAGQAEAELAANVIPSIAGAAPLFWVGIIELLGGIVMLFKRFYKFGVAIFSVYLGVLLFVLFKEYSSLLTQNIFSFTTLGDKLVRTIGLVSATIVLLVNGKRYE